MQETRTDYGSGINGLYNLYQTLRDALEALVIHVLHRFKATLLMLKEARTRIESDGGGSFPIASVLSPFQNCPFAFGASCLFVHSFLRCIRWLSSAHLRMYVCVATPLWEALRMKAHLAPLAQEMTTFISTELSDNPYYYRPVELFRTTHKASDGSQDLPQAVVVNAVDDRLIAIASVHGIREIQRENSLMYRARSQDFTKLLVCGSSSILIIGVLQSLISCMMCARRC